ncbi:hypothetical protein EV102420_08_03110 [Pseudescherichia vulneris NBRC 102420]|uniref:Uncharacterized protein n=1 Tax=Pseudescherichia vulneris NBRC 102420 TaxID=1115515 RepID=A0A090V152_PSEVU|nr:hypothetical protein [Pseudescherichia vulneris]GAL57848.1 hypothetical protein EV102420_08_03110 [Pseudescherichia vulneris NBRC 102420]
MSSTASVLAVPAIGIAAWIIGGWMITDSMTNKSKGKVLSRATGVVGGFGIGIVAFVIALVTIYIGEETKNDVTTQEVSTNVSGNSLDADVKDAKTFDITSEAYIERMNKILSRMEKPIKIDVHMNELEYSSFGEYLFDKNIKLSVMANNGDHKMRGAIITSINDGATETSLKTLYLVLPAFMSVMDEKASEGVPFVDIITNLMAGKYPDDTYEINGVHYALVHKDGGDFFFIRPV